MTISLSRFASGDTDYISKMDTDNETLETAINALQAEIIDPTTLNLTMVNLLVGLFPGSPVLLGSTSFAYTLVGSLFEVTAGYIWIPSSNVLVFGGGVNLDFTGKAAGTYYIEASSTGVPSIVNSSTEPIYSVVWTGSAFGTITLLAQVFFTSYDDTNALTSTALAQIFLDLDSRLEAGENIPGRVAVKTANYTPTLLQSIADRGYLLAFNGSSLTYTLRNPAPSTNWLVWVSNLHASILTIAHNSRNIDGVATDITLAMGESVLIFCDGTDYYTVRGSAAGGSGGGGGVTTWVVEELVGGTANGSNTAFTISHTPVAGTFKLVSAGGIRLRSGVAYTISGAAITMLAGYIPLNSGEKPYADYGY